MFQGAMNALNPVRRVRDYRAEPIIVRLGVSKSRRGDGRSNCSISSGSRCSAAAPTPRLSGGMRQRAVIAMALACNPAIVIGDEPTTALDDGQAQTLALLESLRWELVVVDLITHDLSVIAETCDKVMIMYAGRVAEEGPVSRVFTAPRHPYTQALLRAFPNIRADRRTLDVIPGNLPDLRDPPPGCRFAPRCPFAMDVCRVVTPPEVTMSDGVRVAWLYPTPDAAIVEPAPIAQVGADAPVDDVVPPPITATCATSTTTPPDEIQP